jgi:hypothetical protein
VREILELSTFLRASKTLIVLVPFSEFKHWLSLYARALTVAGQSSVLRLLVDSLLGDKDGKDSATASLWWISGCDVLGLDREELVKTVILPQLIKNHALQRLTNEISLELANR